jgi:hypothetical protein
VWNGKVIAKVLRTSWEGGHRSSVTASPSTGNAQLAAAKPKVHAHTPNTHQHKAPHAQPAQPQHNLLDVGTGGGGGVTGRTRSDQPIQGNQPPVGNSGGSLLDSPKSNQPKTDFDMLFS